MAVVMPFTTLVGGDYNELTKFLVSEYNIEYVISGLGRMAFSENTQFSELLFVARKERPKNPHFTVLVLTKTSPISWKEEDIKSITSIAKQSAALGKKLETELCLAIPFDQRELLPEGKTLTGLVAELDQSYKKAGTELESIIEKNPLISTIGKLEESGVFEMKVAEVVHGKSSTGGGHALNRFGGDALIACRTEERALRKHERLIYTGQKGRNLLFQDRVTKDTFAIPQDVIAPALRRFPYIDKFELSGDEDFVVKEPFNGAKKLFDSILNQKLAETAYAAFGKEWSHVVESGSARICFPGRINLAAPGTRLLAVHSNRPIFMSSFMWGLYGLNNVEEKVITLWLNSGVFFYLLLARQTVTGGSWVKLHGKQLKKVQFLDIRKLNKSTIKELLDIYDELARFRWPPLIDQYSSPPKERRKLDTIILKTLGVKDQKKSERLIHSLYDAIVSILTTMKATMEAV